jgi:hypothetical protein
MTQNLTLAVCVSSDRKGRPGVHITGMCLVFNLMLPSSPDVVCSFHQSTSQEWVDIHSFG